MQAGVLSPDPERLLGRTVGDREQHRLFPGGVGVGRASAYCALRTVFPKVISGLRKPIAIQAAISFNINLPE